MKKPNQVADLDKVVHQYRLNMLHKSAQVVVEFVCSLQKQHLQKFWLP